MKQKLNVDIAYSLLLARWKQTLVAAIGVTFSIAMFITLLSFMTGLNIMLDSLVINRTPHVRLFNEIQQNPRQPVSQLDSLKSYYHFISSIKTSTSREEIYNSTSILKTLADDNRVLGISPKIKTAALFNNGNQWLNGIIHGVDVQAENKLFYFNDYIVKGTGSSLATIPNSIVLGKALAEILLVDIGDQVYVTTAGGNIFPL